VSGGGLAWRKVRDEVLRRIHTRAWPPGSIIPNEIDLAREFGVARATVNRALQTLALEGWLDRRRRAGTRVARHQAAQARLAIPIMRREIEASGRVYAHDLRRRALATLPPEVEEALGVPACGAWLHLCALHRADGAPYAVEDRWVNPEAAPGLAEATLVEENANEWLLEHVPFTHGTLTIGAGHPDAMAVDALGASPTTPLLVLERSTWDGERPITWVRLTFAAGHVLRAPL
jgi:GntR family histidine utilization transcriptional repressor